MRSGDTWTAFPVSPEKLTNAMSLPCAMNRVSLPSRKDGRNAVRLDRSTTTWNEPLAAS